MIKINSELDEWVMPLTSPVIHSDSDILGGTPVFIGTRVPVKTLLDYLEAGEPLDVFLDHFPSVSQTQAIAVLELAKYIDKLKIVGNAIAKTFAKS